MTDKNTKTFHHDGGKGSRPRGTGWDKYYSNFDAIFGKKDKVEDVPTEPEVKDE